MCRLFGTLSPFHLHRSLFLFNPFTPNDLYMSRTAPLTSKHYILYIYSTNIGTEYFKHALYSPFFSLQNAVCFIMLTCLVSVLFTFYIQNVLKLKKNNSGSKGLIDVSNSVRRKWMRKAKHANKGKDHNSQIQQYFIKFLIKYINNNMGYIFRVSSSHLQALRRVETCSPYCY